MYCIAAVVILNDKDRDTQRKSMVLLNDLLNRYYTY